MDMIERELNFPRFTFPDAAWLGAALRERFQEFKPSGQIVLTIKTRLVVLFQATIGVGPFPSNLFRSYEYYPRPITWVRMESSWDTLTYPSSEESVTPIYLDGASDPYAIVLVCGVGSAIMAPLLVLRELQVLLRCKVLGDADFEY